MADISFYLYPNADAEISGSGSDPPNWQEVDDPYDALDALVTHGSFSTSGSPSKAWARWGLTLPQSAVVITKIRVYYSVFTKRFGVYDLNSTPQMKGVVYVGGTYYASSTGAIEGPNQGASFASGVLSAWPFFRSSTQAWQVDAFGSGSADGPVLAYWEWTTNPNTSLAWTIGDLQSLQVAWALDSAKGSFDMPSSTGTPRHQLSITACHVKVFAQTVAASIEGTRGQGSAFLRFLRDPLPVVSLRVPVGELDAGPGDVLAVSHLLGPDSAGGGWGRNRWSRRYVMILSRDLDPGEKTWRLQAADMREVHANLWFPAITDAPYTEQGQGIPYLDAGGGRSMSRRATNEANAETFGYVRRHADDVTHVQVPQNKEKWSPDGVALFRESRAALQNNSFSQGSGNSFTGWTDTSGGTPVGVVTQSTVKHLFDASGLRRSAHLDSAAGGWAALTQGVSLTDGPTRVHVVAERSAGSDAQLYYRVSRSTDNWYWNDSTGAWQSAVANNPLTSMAIGEVGHTHSKIITAVGATATISLQVVAAGGNDMYVYYANLWWGASVTGGFTSSGVDMERPPFVTTTAAAYEGQDILSIGNASMARAWDPVRGTGFARLKTAWADADMETGDPAPATPTKIRVIALSYVDASNYDLVAYYKEDATTSHVFFKRRVAGVNTIVELDLTGDDRPSAGSVMRVSWRWQATDGELGLTDYTGRLVVITDGRTPVVASGLLQTWLPDATTVYVGGGFHSQPDGWMRSVEISPYVLSDNEVLSRLGV